MTQISLVIPCYNEALNIPELLKCCYLAFKGKSIEVIIVDNGSTDNTNDVLANLLPQYPSIKSIRLLENKGYGYGIIAGLKEAQGLYIGWMHADLQTKPIEILKVLDLVSNEKGLMFIKGKRYGRSFLDLIFTIGMSIFDSCLLKAFLWDINAQPSFFPKQFFSTWHNPPHDCSLDLYVYYLAIKKKLIIKRIPVFFGKRLAGEAHLKNLRSKIKFSIKIVLFSIKLKKLYRL